MAVSLTHTTAATGTDSGDGKISKNAWNEAHTLTGTADRLLGFNGSGVAAEVSVGTGLSLSSSSLTLDADLQTWAGVTPSANGQSLVAAANYAAMRALLDLEAGTDFIGIGGGTYTGDVSVPDEAYGSAWNGSVEVPTKNAVYDKFESFSNIPWVSANWVLLTPCSGGGVIDPFTPGNALQSGTIYYIPFILTRRVTISDLGTIVTTTSNTKKIALAVYGSSASTGLPDGAALAATGDITLTASTGFYSADITGANVTLDPGLYYASAWCDDATPILACGGSVNGGNFIANIIGNATGTNVVGAAGNTGLVAYTSSETFNSSAWPNATSETLNLPGDGRKNYVVMAKVA